MNVLKTLIKTNPVAELQRICKMHISRLQFLQWGVIFLNIIDEDLEIEIKAAVSANY